MKKIKIGNPIIELDFLVAYYHLIYVRTAKDYDIMYSCDDLSTIQKWFKEETADREKDPDGFLVITDETGKILEREKFTNN